MKTCGQCIYYEPSKTMKNIGTCQVPVPYWVTIEFDSFAFVSATKNGVAPLCQTYTEALSEVAEEEYETDLKARIKMLEEQIYLAKVQESLMRPIVDDHIKG